MKTRYAKIRLFNTSGEHTETCIVYSESELKERLRHYRANGFASNGYFKHYEVS